MKKAYKIIALIFACALFLASFAGCAKSGDEVVLRVSNWEEYLDLGGWDESERIDIENPYSEGGVIGKNSMPDDFSEWFEKTYGYKVKVEYSTFGTNEDLYNRLSLGDEYDLVCPSDYMIMKLLAEDAVLEYSDGFWDTEKEENYYAKYVSEFIDGKSEGIYNYPEYGWHKKAACYMWGTTGLVYNPEKLKDEQDIKSLNILLNKDYNRQITIKDNVRDSYFAALGILYGDKLKSDITQSERSGYLNNTEEQTIKSAENVLKDIKDNAYSFETDSGKADMVTGKVTANYQWSGDAVHIMDEADGDGTELWYSVPDECANLWFDGWVMLKNGIDGNERKQQAAEAFVNFLSRPDNAVRNMYYIGYTSAIAGDLVLDYLEYNYGAEEGEEEYSYDVSYFFGDGKEISVNKANFGFDGGNINRGRQLFAQYPPDNITARSTVMLDFGGKLDEINQMWINVRCLDLKDISPVVFGVVFGILGLIAIASLLYAFRYKIFIRNKK